MTWAKLCGSFCFHRKVLEADLLTKQRASGAFARMLSWSAENLTSGKISAAVARAIVSDPRILEALVRVGMLEREGEDYALHDFGDYNPTGESLALHRDQIRAKRSEAGRRGAAVRWGRDRLRPLDEGRGDGPLPSGATTTDPKDPGNPDGQCPSEGMANEGHDPGKVACRRPSTPMASDGNRHGSVSTVPMANDGKPDGKKMPPSPSPFPPPPVVDFALTRVEEPAESEKAKTAKVRIPKHTADEIAAKNRVLQTFVECFKAKKQVEPRAILQADHAKAFELARRFGADEACSIVRRAFEHEFVVRENATMRYIASRADTFRGVSPRKAHARPEQQHAVGDEPWLREHLS